MVWQNMEYSYMPLTAKVHTGLTELFSKPNHVCSTNMPTPLWYQYQREQGMVSRKPQLYKHVYSTVVSVSKKAKYVQQKFTYLQSLYMIVL